ncbi:MAG: aspartate kinase [Syntrophothermus sp.]
MSPIIMQYDMKVFKFGGASVNNAAGIRNVVSILARYRNDNVLLVISAMGKTTNALEQLLGHYLAFDALAMVESYEKIRNFHFEILSELFPGSEEKDFPLIITLFEQLRGYLRKGHTMKGAMQDYHYEYDQVVSYGELISAEILHAFVKKSQLNSVVLDVRQLIKTDSSIRNARVNWELTKTLIRQKINNTPNDGRTIFITQGFIGSDPEMNTTTLGREGSDYTAAIFAYSLNAPEVTIWKDVPGVMNADPKWFPDARKLDTLSYREAIELAYFGASVIHPKTIKPLENSNISLWVKSFRDPEAPGTFISNIEKWTLSFPIYIRKKNQVLISISPRDFSFIIEENLSGIFSLLARHGARVNVMQNSAISFTICVDDDPTLEVNCIAALQKDYHVKYNKNVELYTIRHYTAGSVEELVKDQTVLMEQRTRNTVHLVLPSINSGSI